MRDGEWLFALLMAGILAKSTQFVPDVYIIRGLTQGLCLAAALIWILRHSVQSVISKYLLLFAYLMVLVITAFCSSRPLYVVFQVISLFAVVLFSIAMTEARFDPHRLVTISIVCLAIVCAASLVHLAVSADQAYLHQLAGPRLRGILGQPGALAAASGLLFGSALFARRLRPSFRMILALIALPCLYLTGSRTFWVATVVALAGTALLYRKMQPAFIVGSLLFAVGAALVYALSDSASTSQGLAQVARIDSVETMTGRTLLWQLGLERLWNRPFWGYGFALAADAFHIEPPSGALGMGIWDEEWFTMHNGYIQALLDTGLVGTTLYVAITATALFRMVWRDCCRCYAAIFYGLVFLSVANLGETVIFTAAVFSSVYYWYLAVFALGLRPNQGQLQRHRPGRLGLPPGCGGLHLIRLAKLQGALPVTHAMHRRNQAIHFGEDLVGALGRDECGSTVPTSRRSRHDPVPPATPSR